MAKWTIRRFNVAVHRDLGYFFSGLIIIYCISGLALNHVDDWNPDFVINKKDISFTKNYRQNTISSDDILALSKKAGESKYKIYDFPTPDQVKIYFDNATLHVNFSTHKAVYEQVSRRPLFYQVNILHRNSVKYWKWVADIFAVMLIVISISGLFILKGKHGITRRGKWLVIAGLLIPILAWILNGWLLK